MAKHNKQVEPPVTTTTTTTTKATKQKKRNPTFLTWIVDPSKGLLSPLWKIIGDILGRLFENNLRAQTDSILAAARKGVQTRDAEYKLPVPSPKTLDDLYENLRHLGIHEDTKWRLLQTAIMPLDWVPMVDLSMGDEFRVPGWVAVSERAVSIFNAELRYVHMPILQRYWNKTRTPLIPEPHRLALAAAKEIIGEIKYKTGMAENGLDSDWANMWRDEQYEYPIFEVALALLRRGDIDSAGAKKWMVCSAIPSDVADKLLILKDVIPPLEDLRLMAVREAWPGLTYEQIWAKYKEWAAKLGLSADWAEAYRRAAWRRMDVAEAIRFFLWYDNLPKDFEEWMRIADIHEEDRPRIATVSYNPPTIRELGYGYDTGDYTEADIELARRRGGLRPEDAKKATGALVAYRTEAEREAVRREWLRLYALGKRTKAEFKHKLETLKTNPVAVALWLERGDLEAERIKKPSTELEPRDISRATAQWMFEHGLKTEAWLRTKLAELDTLPSAIEEYVAQSKKRIEEREHPPKPIEYRDLTLTQIRDLYRMERLLKDDVEKRLLLLNYEPGDAKLLSELLTYVPPEEKLVKPYTDTWARRLYTQRLLKTEELYQNYLALDYDESHATVLTLSTLLGELLPSLIARYRKGWINEEGFIRELVWMGMELEDAIPLFESVLGEFQLERLEVEKDLTKAEIIKGWKNRIIDAGQAISLLVGIGYDEYEAEYILAINAVVTKGDPDGYWEMRRIVESSKKARGEAYLDIPDVILLLERKMKEKKAQISKAEKAVEPEKRIAELNVELGDLEREMRTKLIAYKLV